MQHWCLWQADERMLVPDAQKAQGEDPPSIGIVTAVSYVVHLAQEDLRLRPSMAAMAAWLWAGADAIRDSLAGVLSLLLSLAIGGRIVELS